MSSERLKVFWPDGVVPKVCSWLAVLSCLTVRAHPHHPHRSVPVPFPAGSYRHTSSVVNVPIHQERLVIIMRPGNHPPKEGGGNRHGHHPGQELLHHYPNPGHGYSFQEPRSPFMVDPRHVMNYYQESQTQRHPFFQDVGFLLDPRFIQRSLWLEQFPNLHPPTQQNFLQ